jgi:hypothetical protein
VSHQLINSIHYVDTDLVFETGFFEDAGAFSYIFCNLQGIRSKKYGDDIVKLAHTEGSWPVPIGMRQKSSKLSKMPALRGSRYSVRLACDSEEL